MKAKVRFYRAMQLLCYPVGLALFICTLVWCYRMSGGYAGGWSARYCLKWVLINLGIMWALPHCYNALEYEIRYERGRAYSEAATSGLLPHATSFEDDIA